MEQVFSLSREESCEISNMKENILYAKSRRLWSSKSFGKSGVCCCRHVLEQWIVDAHSKNLGGCWDGLQNLCRLLSNLTTGHSIHSRVQSAVIGIPKIQSLQVNQQEGWCTFLNVMYGRKAYWFPRHWLSSDNCLRHAQTVEKDRPSQQEAYASAFCLQVSNAFAFNLKNKAAQSYMTSGWDFWTYLTQCSQLCKSSFVLEKELQSAETADFFLSQSINVIMNRIAPSSTFLDTFTDSMYPFT